MTFTFLDQTFEPVEQCHLEYTPDRGSGIDAHIDDPWYALVDSNMEKR